MDKLLEISYDLKNKTRGYPRNLMDVNLDEEKIFSQNYEAFKVMKKRLCKRLIMFRINICRTD